MLHKSDIVLFGGRLSYLKLSKWSQKLCKIKVDTQGVLCSVLKYKWGTAFQITYTTICSSNTHIITKQVMHCWVLFNHEIEYVNVYVVRKKCSVNIGNTSLASQFVFLVKKTVYIIFKWPGSIFSRIVIIKSNKCLVWFNLKTHTHVWK